ncbi:MAG: pirin family protein [Nanoarchaeota archaeon]|nr:pirin family protein [Nanoarchaeota archaeon]
MMIRQIKSIIASKPTLEGAGVKLKRVFGSEEVPMFDPFLLLDHFGSDDPEDYVKGFPWHPHRGIETVTYMIRGEVEHGDSIGNKGVIKSGDIQWMTAGSGIIHQEMPKPFDGSMMGFQLWVNLARKNKMTKPRYMGITKKDLIQVNKDGAKINLVAGKINNKKGPVKDLFVDVDYFDIHLSGNFAHKIKKKTAFIYVYEGNVDIKDKKVAAGHCALLEKEGDILITGNAKFIFVAGNPLKEPVAWGGPIVMNTQEELDEAFDELDKGTFIKGKIPTNGAEDFYNR